MSWRRFVVLLAGLSADSRWQLALRNKSGERLIEDETAGMNYFATVAAR